MNADQLIQLDKEYVWHPYSPIKQFQKILPVVQAKGAIIYTSEHREIIDAISSWWTNLHGHAHPYIATKLYEQALKLEHVIFAGFTHEPAVELATRIITLSGLNHRKVFYSDNGSTAIEVAIKMAIQYWHNQGTPKKTILAFEDGYHGDTFGAMSVSARGLFTNPFNDLLFDVKYLPLPDGTNRSIQAFHKICESITDPAAFIYEPLIQGTAGMVMYDATEMNQLLNHIKQKEIILIADEVFTGFYRTGTFLASNQLSTTPDIICLSKGLTAGFMPLGLTTCNDRIAGAFEQEDRSKSFFHGHSYTGNPLSCAVANASLDLLERKETLDLIHQLQLSHQTFTESLQSFSRAHKPRYCGTVAAVDFRPDHEKHDYISNWRDILYEFFITRGVLLRPLGTTIYTVPPYGIEHHQMNRIYEVIYEWFEYNQSRL